MGDIAESVHVDGKHAAGARIIRKRTNWVVPAAHTAFVQPGISAKPYEYWGTDRCKPIGPPCAARRRLTLPERAA